MPISVSLWQWSPSFRHSVTVHPEPPYRLHFRRKTFKIPKEGSRTKRAQDFQPKVNRSRQGFLQSCVVEKLPLCFKEARMTSRTCSGLGPVTSTSAIFSFFQLKRKKFLARRMAFPNHNHLGVELEKLQMPGPHPAPTKPDTV